MSLPPACPSVTPGPSYNPETYMIRCWLCWPTYSRKNPPKKGLVEPDDELGLCIDCIKSLQEDSLLCTSETRGLRCQLQAPHPGQRHKHERKNDHHPFETWVLTWVTDDLEGVQPEYPEGAVVLDEWVVPREDFVG